MQRQAGMERRKDLRQLLLGGVCAFALIVPNFAKTSAKPQKERLSFGGETRTYYVFAPSGLVTPAPLLLLLHGSGHDGMSLIDPWLKIAQKEGILAAGDQDHHGL